LGRQRLKSLIEGKGMNQRFIFSHFDFQTREMKIGRRKQKTKPISILKEIRVESKVIGITDKFRLFIENPLNQSLNQ